MQLLGISYLPARVLVSKKLTLSILALALLLGCGKKEEANSAKLLMSANSEYCPLGSLELIDLVDDSFRFEAEIQFANPALRSASAASIEMDRVLSQDRPLRLSYESLRATLEEFKQLDIKDFGAELTQRWNYFKSDLLRWRDYQCSLDLLEQKRVQNIELLSQVKAMRTTGDLSRATMREQRSKLLKLCRPFESGVQCEALLELSTRKGKRSDFIDRYQKRFSDHSHKLLFELKDEHHLSFSCDKGSSTSLTTMNLKVAAPKEWGVFLLNNVKHVVESTWSHPEEFKLNLEWTSSDKADVFIKESEKSLSYVRDDEPQSIYLSKSAPIFQRPLIIAHELGHVLGLPDCYVEYYEADSKTIIYYEPGGEHLRNIMCSMKWGNSASKEALNQIKTQKCSF